MNIIDEEMIHGTFWSNNSQTYRSMILLVMKTCLSSKFLIQFYVRLVLHCILLTSIFIQPATLLKVTLLHGCFSRFLKWYKWYQFAQSITYILLNFVRNFSPAYTASELFWLHFLPVSHLQFFFYSHLGLWEIPLKFGFVKYIGLHLNKLLKVSKWGK